MSKLLKFFIKNLACLSCATLIYSFQNHSAFAASATSSISQIVLASATIDKISDFKFSNIKGNLPNALFSLTGESDKTFSVTLPKKNVVLKSLTHGNTIELKGLTSSLNSTRVKKNGKQSLLISLSKPPRLTKNDRNFYSGRLTIDVVY